MEGTNTQWTKNKSKQIQNTGSKPRMMVLPSAKLRESNVEDFNIESWFNDFLNLLSVEQTFAVLLQTETHKDTGTQREWDQLQVDISYRCPDDRIPRGSIEAARFRLQAFSIMRSVHAQQTCTVWIVSGCCETHQLYSTKPSFKLDITVLQTLP